MHCITKAVIALYKYTKYNCVILILTTIFSQEKSPGLHMAARQGNLDALRHLVEKGTDINIQDDTGVITCNTVANRNVLL